MFLSLIFTFLGIKKSYSFELPDCLRLVCQWVSYSLSSKPNLLYCALRYWDCNSTNHISSCQLFPYSFCQHGVLERDARLEEEEGTCSFLFAFGGFLSASCSCESHPQPHFLILAVAVPFCSSSWIQFAVYPTLAEWVSSCPRPRNTSTSPPALSPQVSESRNHEAFSFSTKTPAPANKCPFLKHLCFSLILSIL